MSRARRTALLAAALASCEAAAQAPVFVSIQPVELTAPVKARIAQIKSLDSTPSSLKSVQATDEHDAATFYRTSLERLDSGLWSYTRTAFGRGVSATRALSLQGLIELAADANVMMGLPGSVLHGRLSASPASTNTIAVEGDLESAVAPLRGGSFFLKQSGTAKSFRASGPGLLGRLVTVAPGHSEWTKAMSCRVGDDKPAATLHPALRGGYLDVTCAGTVDSLAFEQRYAYLLEEKLYLLLETKSETENARYAISGVEYATP